MALSSSVRSIHWVATVAEAAVSWLITYRASEQIRSQRIGLRL